MAAVTEADLEQKRAKNKRLREEIAEAEAKAAAQVKENTAAHEAKLLDSETQKLEARLAAAKRTAESSKQTGNSQKVTENLSNSGEQKSTGSTPSTGEKKE